MLTEKEGRLVCKLIDFSISAVEQDSRADVSQTLQTGTTSLGALAGTPHYMSPEQIQEGLVITPQTDLWSLAVVVFECLSGVLPFAPKEGNKLKICYAIMHTEAPELTNVVEEV
jgi:serine/threonine-protein kinase